MLNHDVLIQICFSLISWLWWMQASKPAQMPSPDSPYNINVWLLCQGCNNRIYVMGGVFLWCWYWYCSSLLCWFLEELGGCAVTWPTQGGFASSMLATTISDFDICYENLPPTLSLGTVKYPPYHPRLNDQTRPINVWALVLRTVNLCVVRTSTITFLDQNWYLSVSPSPENCQFMRG